MQVEAFGQTDVGRVREHNEDYLKLDPSIGLHVVCDGMGGHAAGEVASDTAANSIHRFLLERRSVLLDFDGTEKKSQEIANLLNQAVMLRVQDRLRRGGVRQGKARHGHHLRRAPDAG